jgi:RNA polymerase sigma-70 factor, ECF subfamily
VPDPDGGVGEDLLEDVAVLVDLTDEELVTRSVRGDSDSFNQLIRRWEKPIYALAYRTIGCEDDARDVVQETFLRAFRGLSGFKGQAKFSSWLYRIALNLCRDWIRRQRRAPVVLTPDGVDLVELAGEGEGVERADDRVVRQDLSRAVARAMKVLPEEQRAAIVLKEYHGLTFQEIADLLACPLSTVKTRLYQGLTVLRKELDRSGIRPAPSGGADVRRGPGNDPQKAATRTV